jgi:hypothetical protein
VIAPREFLNSQQSDLGNRCQFSSPFSCSLQSRTIYSRTWESGSVSPSWKWHCEALIWDEALSWAAGLWLSEWWLTA